jgi:hypothetical protein
MPAIRFPVSALRLLPLCKGQEPDSIFRTYADLLGFAAAYGFHLVRQESRRLPTKVTFADTPNAIGLEIFENRGLYTNFLMIALAHDETREIAENEDALAKLVEQYASLGADALAAIVSNRERSEQLLRITDVMDVDASLAQI